MEIATSPTPTESSASHSAAEDTLPPFAALTTDEDREKRAESQSPGTFHVIVNPDSFSHLPEYGEDASDGSNIAVLSLRGASLAVSLTGSLASNGGKERVLDGGPSQADGDDPNIVILSRFEDNTRRANSHLKTSRAELLPEPTNPPLQQNLNNLNLKGESDSAQSLVNVAAQGGQDAGLLDHFRNRVWRQLVQIESDQTNSPISKLLAPGADIFEQQAALFPPVSQSLLPPGFGLGKCYS